MPSRRDFLRAASLAAALPGAALAQAPDPAAKKPKPPPPTILVNDVHAQLSSARVFAVVQPADLDGVRKAFEMAKTEEKAVCIAGGRHSMGGQPFLQDGVVIDTRRLNRVVNVDLERGLVEAEAGINWSQLQQQLAAAQRGLDKPWTFAQKPVGADRATLGGCLSANIHGRGLAMAPFIADIDSFRLLNFKGEIVQCSRGENPELFRLAVGGFGLFGFLTTVTLRLAPRRKLERVVESRELAGLPAAFEERVRDGFLYGECVLAVDDKSPDYLNRGVLVCYRPAAEDRVVPDRPRELAERDWVELLYLAHANKSEYFRRIAAYYQSTNGQVSWSDDMQMSAYPETYHRQLDSRMSAETRATEAIAEIFCERERLEAFMTDLRATARRENIEIIQATVRLVEPDRESFLAWARKPLAGVSLHVHVVHNSSGTIRAGDQFRRLIDLGIKHGGSYLPAYNRYALRRQVDACFPQFQDFLKLKRKLDPQEIIQSDWYWAYKRTYFPT